jgi:teichoic acid transport system permease protein
LTSAESAKVAKAAGLRQMGVRPNLLHYIHLVWNRRSFIWNLSASKAYTKNQGSYLGQAWNILRPTLDALVFIILFGFGFRAGRDGVANIAAFIVIGTFTFSFMQGLITSGVSSIRSNLSLVRSHQFPRAVVPLSVCMTDVVLFAQKLIAMLVIVFLCGFLPGMGHVPLTWTWLLTPVVAALSGIFAMGVGMFFARLGARTPDLANIVPFFLNLLRFASGVMFSISARISPANHDTWWARIIEYQPFAVYLNLMRACFGNDPNFQMSTLMWVLAVVYAVGFFVLGFIFFWGAEETYGRE